jgi:xylulokinase
MSIATFSFYFDIYRKCYWPEMLQAIGISDNQLPPLVEPCTVVGTLTAAAAEATGLSAQVRVNTGTLDHFAGMIGTGNTAPGGMTLSTGTTMVLATMAEGVPDPDCDMALHYGFVPDTYVMLPVMESGGVCLDWFRRTCMGGIDYDSLNTALLECGETQLLFLPYLVGTNAPEFDAQANGVFWGLRQEHDAIDMAGAVMEGVAFVLRKNCDHIAANGVKLNSIIATGGGAKSPVWCQLQADITGLSVAIPKEKEAACLGAAMIAAVSDGRFASYEAAADHCVTLLHRYEPNPTERTEKKYRRFCALYRAALDINNIN